MGIGLDVCELSRIGHSYDRFGDRFAQRILHPDEYEAMPVNRDICISYLASRFAAKEAAVKALGTGFSNGIGFADLAIAKEISGKPILRLYGKAAERAEALGARHVHVSLTHGRDIASAVVILET